jgi:hypothetical protein
VVAQSSCRVGRVTVEVDDEPTCGIALDTLSYRALGNTEYLRSLRYARALVAPVVRVVAQPVALPNAAGRTYATPSTHPRRPGEAILLARAPSYAMEPKEDKSVCAGCLPYASFGTISPSEQHLRVGGGDRGTE